MIALPLAVWFDFRLISPLIEVTNPALAARTSPIGIAQAQAFFTVSLALALTVGSPLGGGIAQAAGWQAAPWVTVGACGAALVLPMVGLAPRFQPKPAAVENPSPKLLAREAEAHLWGVPWPSSLYGRL
jgi:predicted MFS family arabinose efflux permease